jgi:signal transduction histidine kinase
MRAGTDDIGTAEGDATALFSGAGPVRALCREHDWSATSLGATQTWPLSLRTTAATVLGAGFPMILLWGPELVQIYNDGYVPFLAGKHPAGLGQPTRECWPEVWHLNAPIYERVHAGETVTLEDAHFSLRRNGPDGPVDELYITLSYSPVPGDAGGTGGVLVTLLDTTARVASRKAAEERERLLHSLEVERQRLAYVFQRAPAFLAVVREPSHIFEFANEAYYQLVGRRDIIGKPVAEALPEVRDQGFVELLDRVLATGEPFVGREVPVRLARTSGAEPAQRFVDFVYMPMVEADGARSGVIAHGTDVTEHVAARQEIERLLGESERARMESEAAKAEAEGANRAKDEFLSTMSHEFRTPLNAILGYTQLLSMGVLGETTPAQHAHLERMQGSARHLLRLVEDVLDLAKVDAGQLEIRTDTHDTGAVVADALALVQPQATARGIRVVDGSSTAGMNGVATYAGDEHRVRQILINLLSNAVKFTPPGGQVTVTVGSTAEPDPGAQLAALPSAVASTGTDASATDVPAEWAFVRVEDTGPGIDPDLLGRLFEPFVQGAAGLTREPGGTGLGLAISRRLARLMDGDISVRSRPGAGATFTLWLPTPVEKSESPSSTASSHALSGRPSRPTPAGTRAVASTAPMRTVMNGTALDEASYALIHVLGVQLGSEADEVAQRYVAALRADGSFPDVGQLPRVQLRDHATPFVGLIASQLMIIGETRGHAAELLGDGSQIQRVFAELHGAQRHRLGWTERDIERETPILLAEIERALREAAAAEPEQLADSAEAAETAIRYAVDVTRHVLDQGNRIALRAYRFAKAAAAP